MSRQLVTVRKIDQILPIKDSDNIEELVIGGWSVVAQKGLHEAGKNIIYFEIDSFLPESDIRFESFMKFGINTFDGVKGHRVKTKRLRGVYSQGIVMPLAEFPEITTPEYDTDYAELVGIVKYEKTEVSGYTGDAKGSFPWFLRKSDQDRIQNVYGKLANSYLADEDFVGTLKMDGSSITVFAVDKNKYVPDSDDVIGFDIAIGYCSRNQQLKMPESTEDGWFQKTGKFYQGAENSDLFIKAANIYVDTGMSVALQGELVGAGIQGNFEKFDKYQVFVYNIFNVDTGEFLPYNQFKELADKYDIQIVPEVYPAQKILQNSVSNIVKMADGKGLLASYREGVVFKQVNGNKQFKAISNKYLDKEV
jgi:RNA ligase (TIGR02306 family)